MPAYILALWGTGNSVYSLAFTLYSFTLARRALISEFDMVVCTAWKHTVTHGGTDRATGWMALHQWFGNNGLKAPGRSLLYLVLLVVLECSSQWSVTSPGIVGTKLYVFKLTLGLRNLLKNLAMKKALLGAVSYTHLDVYKRQVDAV